MPAVSVRLSDAAYARLTALAERSGHSKTALARQAIHEYLADTEEAHHATQDDEGLPSLSQFFSPIAPFEG